MSVTNVDVKYTKNWERVFLTNLGSLIFHGFVKLMATNTRQDAYIVRKT